MRISQQGSGIFLTVVGRVILLAIMVGIFLPAGLLAQPRQRDIHGPLTRQDFEQRHLKDFAKVVAHPDDWAKGLLADKGGATGDAAANSDRYDVLRYVLDLRIDPELKSIVGEVKFVFAAETPFQEFVFDLTDQLTVDRISHLSGDLVFTHSADSVSVTLPAEMSTGQIDSLTIHYLGYPQEPVFRHGLMYLVHDGGVVDEFGHGGPIVASMSEPAFAKYWWPCKDRPDDKALAAVSLTVPDHLTGVSNGTLVAETAADPGWKTFSWVESYPIASYLISVAVSNYAYLESPCMTSGGTDVPLKNWVFRPDSTKAVVAFSNLCEMMDFCEQRFGPYPFQGEKYGHAEFVWFGAMEHQTVTSIGSSSIVGNSSKDWLIVHELGHQWFGDSLTPHNWADIWLNEGFATYTEALWYEYLGDIGDYHRDLDQGREELSWVQQGPVYDPIPVFPGRVIYDKAAWILHMLRGRMGDIPFFNMLKAWGSGGGRPGSTVTTEMFISFVETYAGENLQAFFDPYLNSTALPQIAYEYQATDGINGTKTHLRLVLQQRQSPLFDNVFPVVITTTAGSDTVRVPLTTAQTIWEFDAAYEIIAIAVDPLHWVLWQPVAGTNPHNGLTEILPNPSRGSYVKIRYYLSTSAHVTLRIFDARGAQMVFQDLGVVDPAGTFNQVGWNEKDSSGAGVPSGVYWAALTIDGDRSVRKFSVIR